MIPLFDDLDQGQRQTVDILHSVDGWPIDFGKDAELVRRLTSEYPRLNIREQAVGFAAWMSEHEQKKKIRYRARFVNWVKKANEWDKTTPRTRRAHRAPETDTHGEAVSTSEGF